MAPSQAVGYGNAAMLFVMLRERIGRQSFEQGLRDFWRNGASGARAERPAARLPNRRAARISGLLRAMAAVALGTAATAEESAGKQGSDLQVRLGQDRPAYQLDVPLRIITAQGAKDVTVRVDQPTQTLTAGPG